MKTKATIGALAVSSLAIFSGSALAEFQDFEIDEGSVPGATANIVMGDKINGGYDEVLTVFPDLTFASSAFANFGQIFANEGADIQGTQLSCIFDACYNMYATFTATGLLNPAQGTFVGVTGSFNLYIDPDQDTTPTDDPGTGTWPDGTAAPALDGTGEDYLIATATQPIKLVGIPGTPGAFDFIWDDFTLTAEGSAYFVDPVPFYMVVRVNGDFDDFPSLPDTDGNFITTGDVSAVFQVPVPGTLALLGLGLAGLGFGARRKS